jgi:methylenetetrahydrofolate dehydrogenase (NADP+)/methenyltetrahydrofolate cyclohydrolase
MIVDGKAIAQEIYVDVAQAVAGFSRAPVMAAITCAPNFETQKYLDLKSRKAAEVGITLRVIELPESVTTEEAVACVNAVLPDVDGVVVQLPFPTHVDREALLAAVPAKKDPDGFSYEQIKTSCLPPVAGAVKVIAEKYDVDFNGKNVVVLGQGRLVGAPVAHFLRTKGAQVTTLTEIDKDPFGLIKSADIIVTGIGEPHFIKPEHVKEGVVVFDAGTSEDGGLMVGDVSPDVASCAALFTPVPGGIGPITVAILLRNLTTLFRQ